MKNAEPLATRFGRGLPRPVFALSRLVACGSCGEALCGKSANGNSGKVPYYEHGWMTRQKGWMVKVGYDCFPYRVLAKRIEPLVLEQVEKFLSDPELAKDLIAQAHAAHVKVSKGGEINRLKDRVQAIQSQLEALTERLAQLPKTVSAKHIFVQMERLEASKAEEEERLKGVLREGGSQEPPAELSSYQQFLAGIRKFTSDNKNRELQAKALQLLVKKIEIMPDHYRIYYFVGRDYIDAENESAKPRNKSMQCVKFQVQEPLPVRIKFINKLVR